MTVVKLGTGWVSEPLFYRGVRTPDFPRRPWWILFLLSVILISTVPLPFPLGKKSYEQYQELFRAGANRYLLRHETANKEHYTKLHPPGQKQENRLRCLSELKKIGYQVGAGFMVGSPYQTGENLVEDLLFLKEFQPEMIGVGPFIPHQDTPFKNCPRGI